MLLQRADHLEPGAVADVRQAVVLVAAERPLEDAPVFRTVEERSPGLEFVDAVGRFLGVELRHTPVVQHLAATHRVAEMHFPVVFAVYVG